MKTILRLTGQQHSELYAHLFPGDNLEAVALVLCGRRADAQQHLLTAYRIVPIPYADCAVRAPDQVTWPTAALVPLLEEAGRRGLAILKIHSHPGYYPQFSPVDDASDRDLFPSIFGWIEGDLPHASAVMLSDGVMFGRVVDEKGGFKDIDSISIVGDDIRFWRSKEDRQPVPEFAQRHAQAFGAGTTAQLRNLAIAVIGCSGTGSPVIEQLARLGVGKIILIDPDRVERRNLNRILNTTWQDAEEGVYKVDALARAIRAMGLDTEIVCVRKHLSDPVSIRAVAGCDVVFGCMDGVEGRHVLSRLAAFYLLPYFDVGVKLATDGEGGIAYNCGSVHYIQPDGASLLERGVYTMEEVRAEAMKRTNPAMYADQVRSKYIMGIQEDRPAVISVNMLMAALAVNEFLARLHPYRIDDNSLSATLTIDLVNGCQMRLPESGTGKIFSKCVGRGDTIPLMEMPSLSESEAGE